MVNKSFVCVGLILCVALWFGTGALAEGISGPCEDDIAKFCKDVKPGGGRLAKCLKEHEPELSDSCKKHQKVVLEHVKAIGQVCSDDISKLCADVKPGGGRVAKCLSEHKDELSEECKEATTKKKGGKKAAEKSLETPAEKPVEKK